MRSSTHYFSRTSLGYGSRHNCVKACVYSKWWISGQLIIFLVLVIIRQKVWHLFLPISSIIWIHYTAAHYHNNLWLCSVGLVSNYRLASSRRPDESVWRCKMCVPLHFFGSRLRWFRELTVNWLKSPELGLLWDPVRHVTWANQHYIAVLTLLDL